MSELKVGDKIRIRESMHNCARVEIGDILEVTGVGKWGFQTDAPRLINFVSNWDFDYEDEGYGWEKVEDL